MTVCKEITLLSLCFRNTVSEGCDRLGQLDGYFFEEIAVRTLKEFKIVARLNVVSLPKDTHNMSYLDE